MAIGPESRRMASGRLVVIASLYATLAAAALVGGLGPVVEETGIPEKLIGALSIVMAAPLFLSAILLIIRRGPARGMGLLGASATMALGAVIAVSGLFSLQSCQGSTVEGTCSVLVWGVTLAGASTAALGVGTFQVIRRAHPTAFRRIPRTRGR